MEEDWWKVFLFLPGQCQNCPTAHRKTFTAPLGGKKGRFPVRFQHHHPVLPGRGVDPNPPQAFYLEPAGITEKPARRVGAQPDDGERWAGKPPQRNVFDLRVRHEQRVGETPGNPDPLRIQDVSRGRKGKENSHQQHYHQHYAVQDNYEGKSPRTQAGGWRPPRSRKICRRLPASIRTNIQENFPVSFPNS